MATNLGKKKWDTLGPTLSCVAMILLILSRSPDDVMAWLASVIACGTLLLVNVAYVRVYDRMKQLEKAADERVNLSMNP